MNGRSQEVKAFTNFEIGDGVLIKKPKKGQEPIGNIVSIGRFFVTVNTATQSIRRIPQNLKCRAYSLFPNHNIQTLQIRCRRISYTL